MKHADILRRMTLEEKASLCSGLDYWNTQPVPSVGIPSVMMTDGPHGIRKRGENKTKEQKLSLKGVPAICFPTAATTACSWDPDLLYEMGEALGEECLAEKVSVLLGPGVNMKRSPLCGRNFEYFSEDPYLAGTEAAAFINGVQSKGVGTSIKHYAANSQETRRMTVNTVADERTLREIYLTAFEIAVKSAQPWTIMAAYNRLNGEYCAENKWLLTDVLRNEWGYNGIVVTDWGAENDRVSGLLAGQELEMPTSNGLGDAKIAEAVRSGIIAESVLDEAADRMIDLALRADSVRGDFTYDSDAHHELARKVAAQSMVLMQNTDNILPLSKKQRVAVIGEMAKVPRYQGSGSSLLNPIKLDSAFDQMLERGISVSYAAGYDIRSDKPEASLIAQAAETAKQAETVLLFVGLTDPYETEGSDRTHMRMPEAHTALLDAVCEANENVVVVLAGGSVIEMPWRNKVKGIFNSCLGGQAGGSAVVDILFGDVNPSGKLAETYPEFLESNPSAPYFPGTSVSVEYREGLYIGYRYYDTAKKEVAFPFGHGLSYTTFAYSDLKLSKTEMDDTDEVVVSFKVKNTGDRDGAEIAQLYVRDRESTIYRPEKELKGYKKVFLKAGEETAVEITLSKRAFAYYNVNLKDWHIESGVFDLLVGASSRDIRLEAAVTVNSTVEAEIPDYRETAPCYYTADIHTVSDEQFKAVYGRALPPAERDPEEPLGICNTLEDAASGKWGGRINKLITKAIPMVMNGSEAGMASGVALQTPVKNFISMSMGVFSDDMADGLLMILNDRSAAKGAAKIVGGAGKAIANIGKLMKSI